MKSEKLGLVIEDRLNILSDITGWLRREIHMTQILDSGNRTEFSTGAVRDMQDDKGRCDLLPLDVVAASFPVPERIGHSWLMQLLPLSVRHITMTKRKRSWMYLSTTGMVQSNMAKITGRRDCLNGVISPAQSDTT